MKRVLNLLFTSFVFLTALGLLIGLSYFFPVNQFLNDVELKTYDLRRNIQALKSSNDIVMISFDETTSKLNRKENNRAEFAFDTHADVLATLRRAGARFVVYDYPFSNLGEAEAEGYQRFLGELKQFPSSVLSVHFDNDYEANREFGLELTESDVKNISPLSLKITNSIEFSGQDVTNDTITFNNYRKLIPDIANVSSRLGVNNLNSFNDGIVRDYPLFYKFQYPLLVYSDRKPFTQNEDTHQWFDTSNRRVLTDGTLLSPEGSFHFKTHVDYFPSLALQAYVKLNSKNASETKIDHKADTSAVTSPLISYEPNLLSVINKPIALNPNQGVFTSWYRINRDWDDWREQLVSLKVARQNIELSSNMSEFQKNFELKTIDASTDQLTQRLQSAFLPKPYREVPVWRVLQLQKNGFSKTKSSDDDRIIALLKDKIVFVGVTDAERTDYRLTPIGALPSIAIHATAFDNLYQNTPVVSHSSAVMQGLLVAVFCLMVFASGIKIRSIGVEIGVMVLLAVAYVVTTVLLFTYGNTWFDIVVPLVFIALSALVVLLGKYVYKNYAYSQVFLQANTDSMTGLYNYRYFKKTMDETLMSSSETDTKFSLILLDIDHFKNFNDTHGHQAGDEVLRCVARQLKILVRASDQVFRYGGEEMAILIKDIHSDDHELRALQVASKVVNGIAAQAYDIGGGVTKKVTVSAGVATFPTHGQSLEVLVEFADQGLYRAKENGRNQVGAQFDGY